ncbi:hypothetical protein AMEX_G15208 [Astyanax mexicanus]|uniref:Uncharacterized protein n=1 Tax=Astyanax mexicanus TaxID=7994 RepID=A0A8T2LE76_ASTMX|nr:hypothetical protein AMEX_G15208 [Astyanax mexicanus]
MNMDPETPADALSAGGALSVPESSRNVAAEGGGAEVRDAEGETPAAKAVRQVHPALQAGAPAAEAVRQLDPALQAGAPAAEAVRQLDPALQAGASAAEAVRQADPALQAGAPAAVRQADPALQAGAPAAEAVRQADPALQAGAPAAVRQADPALQAGAPAAEDAQRMPDGLGNVLPGVREAEGESAVGGGSTEVKTDPPPGADASAAQDAKSTAAVGKANTRPNESKNRRNKGAGCVTNAHTNLQNNTQEVTPVIPSTSERKKAENQHKTDTAKTSERSGPSSKSGQRNTAELHYNAATARNPQQEQQDSNNSEEEFVDVSEDFIPETATVIKGTPSTDFSYPCGPGEQQGVHPSESEYRFQVRLVF